MLRLYYILIDWSKLLAITMKNKSLAFHIKSDDYFGTLATIISLIRQNGCFDNQIRIFKKLEKDLIFLQNNYKIVKK